MKNECLNSGKKKKIKKNSKKHDVNLQLQLVKFLCILTFSSFCFIKKRQKNLQGNL